MSHYRLKWAKCIPLELFTEWVKKIKNVTLTVDVNKAEHQLHRLHLGCSHSQISEMRESRCCTVWMNPTTGSHLHAQKLVRCKQTFKPLMLMTENSGWEKILLLLFLLLLLRFLLLQSLQWNVRLTNRSHKVMFEFSVLLLRLIPLRPIHTRKKRKRMRTFSLNFCHFSLIFFSFTRCQWPFSVAEIQGGLELQKEH